jgi:hypothetical protein
MLDMILNQQFKYFGKPSVRWVWSKKFVSWWSEQLKSIATVTNGCTIYRFIREPSTWRRIWVAMDIPMQMVNGSSLSHCTMELRVYFLADEWSLLRIK